jgi:hypothetical protein
MGKAIRNEPTRNGAAHIKALRELCEQAAKLSEAAQELCERLERQMEATRASVLHAHKGPERRRKIRKAR